MVRRRELSTSRVSAGKEMKRVRQVCQSIDDDRLKRLSQSVEEGDRSE